MVRTGAMAPFSLAEDYLLRFVEDEYADAYFGVHLPAFLGVVCPGLEEHLRGLN